METTNDITIYTSIKPSSIPDLERRVNVPAVVVSALILSAGFCILLVLTVKDPQSNLNILRVFAGWVAAVAGLCGLLFASRHWVYAPTGSPVRHRRVDFNAERFPELRRIAADCTDFGSLPISDNSVAYIDCYASKDKEFAAMQMAQYSAFGDRLLTPIGRLTGGRAKAFLQAVDA